MGRPTLLRVRLVHHEASHQKDTFVSTFFCVSFLSLKIVTIFCNLVLLNACKYFYSPRYFTACECLLSSIILDTQPLTLINGNSASGMTWEPPKKYYTRCVFAFREAFPQSPVPQGPSHLLPLTGQLQRRSALFMKGDLLRPRKVRAQPPALRAPGHPRL